MPTLYVTINQSPIGSFPDSVPSGLDPNARITLAGTNVTCFQFLLPAIDLTGPNVDRNYYEQSFGAITENEPSSGRYKSFFVSEEVADTLNITDLDETRAVDDTVINTDWSYSFFNVVDNDLFASGTLPTSTVVFTQPSSGLVELSGAVEFGEIGDGSYGSLRYTPDPDFLGTVSFEYTIEDSDGATDTATVTIEVVGDRTEPWEPPLPDASIDTEQEVQEYIDDSLIRRDELEERGWDVTTAEDVFGPNPPAVLADLISFDSAPYQYDDTSGAWNSTDPSATNFAQGTGEYSYFNVISDTLASAALMALQAFGVAKGFGPLSRFLGTANDARQTHSALQEHMLEQTTRLDRLSFDDDFDYEKFSQDTEKSVEGLVANVIDVPFIGPLMKKLILQSSHSDVSYKLSTTGPGSNLFGGHSDRIIMSEANDYVDAGSNNDFLFGMEGNDTLFGGADADILSGGEGDDDLLGDDGTDQLWGGAGDDVLFGGDDADRMLGGDGEDALFGGQGNDTIDGGSGADYVSYFNEGGGSGIFVRLDQFATDTFGTVDTLIDIENVRATEFSDTVFGSNASNRLRLAEGDDLAFSPGGADAIDAGSGNDVIYLAGTTTFSKGFVALNVSSGTQVGTNQRVNLEGLTRIEAVSEGGAGADTIELTNEGDAFFLHDAYSAFHSVVSLTQDSTGMDNAPRFSSIERIATLGGDDIIDLTSSDYSLAGMSLLIEGGDGNDTIWGSDADEQIYGGTGNDVIFAGIGNDVVFGGPGADRFEITATSGGLRIGDFDPSEGDTIRFYNSDGYEVLRTDTFDSVFYAELDNTLRMIVDGQGQRLFPIIDLSPFNPSTDVPIQGVIDSFESI